MVSYEKLFKILKDRGISTYVMRHEWGIANPTIERLKRNDSVSTNTLSKICDNLSCRIEDIVEHVPSKGKKK